MSTAAPQRPAPAPDAATRPAPADSALRRILSGNGTVTVLAILLSLLISGLLIIAVDEDVRDAAGYFFARPSDLLSAPLDRSAMFPRLLGTDFRLHWGFFVALLAVLFTWWLMQRSTLGFRLRAVGANPDAARTAGISVKDRKSVV